MSVLQFIQYVDEVVVNNSLPHTSVTNVEHLVNSPAMQNYSSISQQSLKLY